MTTVVMPCQQEQVPKGSQKIWASMWVWPSTKPGATTWPSASRTSLADSRMRPMAAILPPLTPTSARYRGRPDPSTTQPFLIRRSKAIDPLPSMPGCTARSWRHGTPPRASSSSDLFWYACRAMDLGIFDHLDRRDVPVHEHYESRLRLLEKYDAAGFYSYHLAEHHATPLGLAPVPGIFLAAATQRTRRIRLGPCVYCLPLYDPLRLIEEVCMLDQLSRGRFDFGVGRGIVPYEMAYFNLHHLETEEIYREALEVIVAGLTSEVLEHRGPHYTYRKVPMVLRPFQTPHPPLWYGLGHDRGAEWAAANGVHVLSNHPPEGATELFARYRDVWHRKQGTAPMPKLGMTRHVVVASTDAEAEAIARPNYATWYANLTKLWRDFGSTPIRFARDFDEARQRGLAVAGTAARVREELERQIAVSTCTYLVVRPIFGDVTEAEAGASIDRFASEVLPHLTALKPVA